MIYRIFYISICLFLCFLTKVFGLDEEELFFFEDQILSGSHLPTQLTKAPFTITILENREIQLSGFSEIYDILRFQPGIVYFHNSASEVSLGMRGTSQFLSNNLLLLLDGKPIYDELLGNNFWSFLPITIYDVDRIEIIRGPESVIYGANAFSGVINIITKKAVTSSKKVEFSSAIGTPYRHLYHFAFSPYKNYKFYFSGAWDEVGSFEKYQHRTRRIRKFFFNFDHNLFGNDSLSLMLGLSDGDYEFKPYGIPGLSHRYGYQLFSNINYRKYPYNFDFIWQKIEGKCPERKSHYLDIIRQQLIKTLLDHPKHQFLFGLGWDYYRIDSSNLGGRHEQFLYHFFFEDHYKLGGNFILVSALRFDHHPITGEHFTPKISLIYSLKPGHSFRFSWGRAFKNPSLFQTYKNFCQDNVCHKGSNNLNSEKIDVFEASYQGFLRSNIYLSFAIFYNIYRDILSAQAFRGTGCRLIIPSYNNGKMYQYGYEVETSFDFSSLTAKINYTYIHLDKDDRVAWGPIPSHQINLSLLFKKRFFFANFSYHWQSEAFYTYHVEPDYYIDIDTIPSYDWATFSFGVQYDNYILSFLVENLFNNLHKECLSCPEIGTYFTVNFSIKF